jgi:putative transposase
MPIHRKTIKHYDTPGHAHYLTFSCFRRQPFFDHPQLALWVWDAVTKAKQRHPFDLWAYVIMPEHLHLLVWPQKSVRISDILYAVKQSVTKRVLLWAPTEHPTLFQAMADVRSGSDVVHRFWLRGPGYDRNLWTPHDIHEKIRYIHANPVRRGLVTHPGDWLWSSWAAWHEGETPLTVDRHSVPTLVK